MTHAARPPEDLAIIARGGRTNFLGFVLRLAARLPFLFIAGRLYGAEALGRFAYAVIIVEFAAQLATLGLKRGLAHQLSTTSRPHVHVVWDGMLTAFIASAALSAILFVFPQAMFPNSEVEGVERLLALLVFATAGSEVALAALAYRHNIRATVHARAIIEPWTISIAAAALWFVSSRDGLIIAYVISMLAALAASIWPLVKSYGLPRGWSPHPSILFAEARANMPLAAADAIEWGSRRLDIAILGLFFAPYWVGLYYVAQQVASLPQKLKTSFDPILGPAITKKLAENDLRAVARQVRQVGFWIIAAQAAIGLAFAIPAEAVLGVVGPQFVGATAVLVFLLAAEVIAATAAVSEAALVYIARHRNLLISFGMLAAQTLLSIALILGFRALDLPVSYQAAGPAIALCLALGLASLAKAALLKRLLEAPVSGWRWPLVWAAAAATVVGYVATQVPEWGEILVGMPAIMLSFGLVIWHMGFLPEDRVLFRLKQPDVPGP
ncbi:MAG: lipopolysaccharide biosynthesis protein [Sphingomonadaceae bacterium]